MKIGYRNVNPKEIDFCVNHCPHPNASCKYGTCREFQKAVKEFRKERIEKARERKNKKP